MYERGFRHLPVIDHGRPVGVLSARHALDLAQHEQSLAHADGARVAEEEFDREDVRRIADVDCYWRAVRAQHRYLAAAKLRSVLDVVMDEEGIVEELERGRRDERLLGTPPGCPARGEADRRAQPLAFSKWIVRQ